MVRVFLSHASSDKAAIHRIATALRAAGHDPWLDGDMLMGESNPAVTKRLRDADLIVFCLSKAPSKRGWLEGARNAMLMRQFREQKLPIFLVRLEDVPLPFVVAPLFYVDLFPTEQAFTEGIAQLNRIA